MPDPQPAYQSLQYAFAAHLRDPARNAAPVDVEDRRMQIYRDLFYNNIEGFIASGFPVLRTLYTDDDWHALVRRFYAQHISHSPQFYQIAEEFMLYLRREHEQRACDPDFMLELAHYEWIEMILTIDVREPSEDQVDKHGDLLAEIPVLNPCLYNLAYHYPVHRISSDFRPKTPDEYPTQLVAYRTMNDEIVFLEVNIVTARLLEQLEQVPYLTGSEHLKVLAHEFGKPVDVFLNFGKQTLEDLCAKQVLLGTTLECL